MPWFAAWRRSAEASAAEVRVRFVTRRDCPLCDVAYAELERTAALLRRRHGHVIVETVDVAASDRRAEYTDRVPVVEIAGRPRLWGRINPALLCRTLLIALRQEELRAK